MRIGWDAYGERRRDGSWRGGMGWDRMGWDEMRGGKRGRGGDEKEEEQCEGKKRE